MIPQLAVRRFISTKLNTNYHSISSQFRHMASTLPRLSLFEAISSHNSQSLAVIQSKSGESFTYGELLKDVAAASKVLRQSAGNRGLDGQRVAFLVENSYRYVGENVGVKQTRKAPMH